MLTIELAKQMAAKLKTSLDLRDHKISYSAALETVAHQLGYKDWNTAEAALPSQAPQPKIHFIKPIPILRMFDERKAREFYHLALNLNTGSSPTCLCILALSGRGCSCTCLNITVTLAQALQFLFLCTILSCSETNYRKSSMVMVARK